MPSRAQIGRWYTGTNHSAGSASYTLADPLSETALEITVGVEAERLETSELRLLWGATRHLEEIPESGRKLLVAWQCHSIDVCLGPSNRVVIEPCQSRCHRVDLGVELVICDGAIDVAVLLGARRVEIIGNEKDLERTTAPH